MWTGLRRGSIGDLLARRGLVREQRRRRRGRPVLQPFTEARGPNDVWCADFKGWFRTRNGARCDPLSDQPTRIAVFLMCCDIVAPTGRGVAPVFERVFREYGLPLALRTDNGSPFASQGAAGLTRLAVSFVKLGIRLGADRPRQATAERASRAHAPHAQAGDLGSRCCDAACAAGAVRPLPQRPTTRCVRTRRWAGASGCALCAVAASLSRSHSPEPWYDAGPRRAPGAPERRDQVARAGWSFVSEAVVGEPVGIAETDLTGDWIVRFCEHRSRHHQPQDRTGSTALPHPGPGRGKARKPEQTEETVYPCSRSIMLPLFSGCTKGSHRLRTATAIEGAGDLSFTAPHPQPLVT